MVDESNETQANEPQLVDMSVVVELVRHMGQIMSNTSLYGPGHKVTQQAITKGFEFLNGLFSRWERISFSIANNSLLADGREIEMKNALMNSLVKQLSAIEVGSFSLVRGMTFDDFAKLMALLNTRPENMKAIGSFSDALAQSGIAHVQAKSVVYQLVAEEDVVVNKSELENALVNTKEEKNDEGGAENSTEEIIAFLKGAAGEMAMDIEQAVSNTHQLADLILKAAEVSPEKAHLDGAETLGDIVVGCLRRAYQSMLQDPASKTQQGKKTIAKTLMLLQEDLLQGLRELTEPAAGQITEMVAEAVEEMNNELQVDALASDYVKKRKGVETTEKKILRFMKAAGKDNPEASSALKEKLIEGGLDAEDWQQLLLKNAKTSLSKAGMGIAGAEALGSLLAQMNELSDAKTIPTGPSTQEEQVRKLVTQIEQEVATVTAEATQKLDQLEKRLRNRPEMSRESILAMLAEIGQEICQPLAVIKCSLDMILSKALGEISAMQKEMLDLAVESGSRVEMLANKLIEISGMPKGTKPDTEILDDVYGR